jgi:hypothetical protein
MEADSFALEADSQGKRSPCSAMSAILLITGSLPKTRAEHQKWFL